MTYKQVKFRTPNVDTVERKKEALGGIAYYENELDKTPKYIICGCCGGLFVPEDFEIVRVLEWIPISEEILGE